MHVLRQDILKLSDLKTTACFLLPSLIIADRPCVALIYLESSRTLVRKESLPRYVIVWGGLVDIVCIHNDKVEYPLAEVTIQVEGQPYVPSVGVFQLPYQVVLGCDLPVLADVLAKQSFEARTSCSSDSLLAVTRSKSKLVQSSLTMGWEELPFAFAEVSSVQTEEAGMGMRYSRS